MNKMIANQYYKTGLVWIILLVSVTASPIALSNYASHYQTVDIEIINDQGESFSVYPVTQRYLKNEYRAYLEATKGNNYALRIRNHSNRRIGLVIAIDGRNIISGKKSYLKPTENMYILGPNETQTYSGWRTSSSDIHRFYFTDIEDSYAHAFNDDTATGVIAVAVFEENQPRYKLFERKKSATSPAPSANRSSESEATADQAGTGFGEHQTSHVYRVEFNAKRSAKVKYFFKYEWHETLCLKQIIDCPAINDYQRHNRFWPKHDSELGFAPFPPGYRY